MGEGGGGGGEGKGMGGWGKEDPEIVGALQAVFEALKSCGGRGGRGGGREGGGVMKSKDAARLLKAVDVDVEEEEFYESIGPLLELLGKESDSSSSSSSPSSSSSTASSIFAKLSPFSSPSSPSSPSPPSSPTSPSSPSPSSPPPPVTFESMARAILSHSYYRFHPKKYFIALTLEETATLRFLFYFISFYLFYFILF